MSNKHVSWVFKQSFEKKNNGPVEHFTFLKNVCYQYFNFEFRVTYCFFYELLLGPQPTSLECVEPFSKRARFGNLPNVLQNIGKRVWSAVACSLYTLKIRHISLLAWPFLCWTAMFERRLKLLLCATLGHFLRRGSMNNHTPILTCIRNRH